MLSVEVEYTVNVFSNLCKLYEVSIKEEVDCDICDTWDEECHGCKKVFDISDEVYEQLANEAQEKFEASSDCMQICEEQICDRLAENEHIIGFTRDLEAKIKKSGKVSEWACDCFLHNSFCEICDPRKYELDIIRS